MSPFSPRIRTAVAAATVACALAPMVASAAPPTSPPITTGAKLSSIHRGGDAPARFPRATSRHRLSGIHRGGRTAHLRSASNSAFASLTFSGTCDYINHQNAFSASVQLNSARFPNGGQVWIQYASKPTSWTGSAPWGGWYGPYSVNNFLGLTAPNVWGPGEPMYGPRSLPVISYNRTSGQFYGAAQVAVRTAAGFEYAWTWSDSYLERGRYGLHRNASSCWASV